MIRKLAILLLCVACSGCVLFPQGQALRIAFRDLSEKASDAALADTLWALCRGNSRGAHDRWIKTDTKLADAVITVCSARPTADSITSGSDGADAP